VSEDFVSKNEARLASTLFYGLMGGVAGSGSCCCWPISMCVAWVATRRAVSRGTIAPGDGLGFGLGLGGVMGLVMASLGTALALSNLQGPEGEAVAALMADSPMWIIAMIVAVVLGGIGLVSGLMGGLLGSGQRPLPVSPSPATTVPRLAVPVPGSMPAPPSAGEEEAQAEPGGAEQTSDSAPPERPSGEVPILNPEDFVTAESEPQNDALDLRGRAGGSTDVDRTITMDQDPLAGDEDGDEDEGD
jgi:hypothetical protein